MASFAGRFGPQPCIDLLGNAEASLAVDVFARGSTTVRPSLYADINKTTPLTNPVFADEFGNLSFCADPGEYDIRANGVTFQITISPTIGEFGSAALPILYPRGLVGDGVADDTAALATFFASLSGTDYAVIPKPRVAYLISSTLQMPVGFTMGMVQGITIFWENVLIRSTVANGPVIDMSSETQCLGRLNINCQNMTGSIGVRFGGVGTTYVQHSFIQHLTVLNAGGDSIVYAGSDTQGTYYNRIGYARVAFGAGHAVRFSSSGTVNNVNTNSIGYLSAQVCGGDGVHVDGGDGNQIDYMECESNTGWGVRVLRANGFDATGWLEGNGAGASSVAPGTNNVTIATPQLGVFSNADTSSGALTAAGIVTANAGAAGSLQLAGDTIRNVGTTTDRSIYMAAKGAGGIVFGANANAGTGGVQIWSGGATPSLVISLTNAGHIGATDATFTGSCFANNFYSLPFTTAAVAIDSGVLRAAGSGTDQNLYIASKGAGAVVINGVGGDGTSGLFVESGGGSPFLAHMLLGTSHTFGEGVNQIFGTTTGTKLGTGTTQKLGFWNASPIVQPARIGQLTDNSGGTSGGSTIAAVTSVATAANAIATLAAKYNTLEAKLSAAAGGVGLTA